MAEARPAAAHPGRIRAVRRHEERVTPLELFFDLVFVLAITQCTALMADDPTWRGLARGMLVLGVLWWSWVGYAWLTSVVDPEEGATRLLMFGAMAALLVVSLCVPRAFGDLGLTFAVFYGMVRAAHIGLFWLASDDDPALRRSVTGLGVGTAVGVALLVAASFFDGTAQGLVWLVALALDQITPFVFGSEGWRLVPGHFAERHGLILIIALGESIVAIGVGAETRVAGGEIAAAAVGVALLAAMWWAYFDVVAYVGLRRLTAAAVGKEQNELARDLYSYLHFPMVASIVLVALGLKKTLAHVSDPLETVPGFALVGGTALYLLAHVAFRLRNTRSVNKQRLVLGVLLLAASPLATSVPAVAALAGVTVALCSMIAYEAIRFAEGRRAVRHQHGAEPPSP